MLPWFSWFHGFHGFMVFSASSFHHADMPSTNGHALKTASPNHETVNPPPGGDPRNPFDIVSSDSDAFDLLGQSGDDGDSSDMAAWMHGSDMADIENMFPDSDSEGSAPSPPKEAPEKPGP